MTQFQVIFVNYYDSKFLADGITVSIYPFGVTPSPANLLQSAVIGAYPAQSGTGEAILTLQSYTEYQVTYSGTNIPSGNHYLYTKGDIRFTVPIYFQSGPTVNTFTYTSRDLFVPGAGSLLAVPVVDSSQFHPNDFVIISSTVGVILAIINSIPTSTEIDCVVNTILSGSFSATIPMNSLVSLFVPNSFKGLPGAPGLKGLTGSGVTTTDPISGLTIVPAVTGVSFQLPVVDGTGFPNFTYITLSDGTTSLTGKVFAGGGTNLLTIAYYGQTSGAPGATIAAGATLTFSGPQGIQGNPGLKGDKGDKGDKGLKGSGPTVTVFTVQYPSLPSTAIVLPVSDTTAFPVNSYIIATDSVSSTLYGQVTSIPGDNTLHVNIITSTGTQMTSGSLVTFSGPIGAPSTVPGPVSTTPGPIGPPGHGATITTTPILVAPIGTLIQLTVENNTAFPIYQYVLITDNVYAITGQIQVVDLANKILGVRIYSVQNATVGSQIQPGASVTFSGPPGPPGTLESGSPGTVLFKNLQLPFDTTYFNTGSGILTNTSLGPVLQLKLPGVLENGLSPNFRVEVELNGAMATNQMITSSNAYLGIGTTTAPIPGTASRIFSGYLSPPQPASTIPNATCLGDAPLKISQPGISGAPCIVKFYGTYAANTTLAFSVLATAQEPNATLYVSAELTIKAYPIYN